MKMLEHEFWYKTFHIEIYSEDEKPSNCWCWFEIRNGDVFEFLPTHQYFSSISDCILEVKWLIDEAIRKSLPDGVLLVNDEL